MQGVTQSYMLLQQSLFTLFYSMLHYLTRSLRSLTPSTLVQKLHVLYERYIFLTSHDKLLHAIKNLEPTSAETVTKLCMRVYVSEHTYKRDPLDWTISPHKWYICAQQTSSKQIDVLSRLYPRQWVTDRVLFISEVGLDHSRLNYLTRVSIFDFSLTVGRNTTCASNEALW